MYVADENTIDTTDFHWHPGALALDPEHTHMTLTSEELDIDFPSAALPITDTAAWLAAQPESLKRDLRSIAELFTGVAAAAPKPDEDGSAFLRRTMGMAPSKLVVEIETFGAAQALAVALALGELIDAHSPEIGPIRFDPPAWTETEVGDQRLRHPLFLRAHFKPGVLLGTAAVSVSVSARAEHGDPAQMRVLVRPEHRDGARAVLDRLIARGEELNPLRGRILRAEFAGGLALSVIDVPTQTRATVVVDQGVWDEIDLAISSIRRADELTAMGLPVRRGVLLVGPPGTGKSAVSAAVARELCGEFTVFYVEARAGARLLTDVVEEARKLEPAMIVLEDVDLFCQSREVGGGAALSELLRAMDIASGARILTVASTNSAVVLDKAAIRNGRFDAVIEVGHPDRAAAARILATLLAEVPGGDGVDTAAVATQLPGRTSGADIREIVRRAVLARSVTTAGLLAEVGAGRYRAEVPGGGNYL